MKAEKWAKAKNDDDSDDHGRVAVRIPFETFERCSTVDPDKVDFQMLEPLVVFQWMLTSVQLVKVEIAAKTLSTGHPGHGHASRGRPLWLWLCCQRSEEGQTKA